MAARRALLALRSHGALPPASASRHRLTPARPRAVAAISGGAGWGRRYGESGESGERKAWFGALISGTLVPLGGVLLGRGGPGRCFGAAAALPSVFVLVEVSSQIPWGFRGSRCTSLQAAAVKVRVASLLRPLGSSWRARVSISCYFVKICPTFRLSFSGVSNSVPSFLRSKDSVSLLGSRKLFFDTHALVCLLEGHGNLLRSPLGWIVGGFLACLFCNAIERGLLCEMQLLGWSVECSLKYSFSYPKT